MRREERGIGQKRTRVFFRGYFPTTFQRVKFFFNYLFAVFIATGNFVKIAQRVPVRITVDPDQEQSERLRPGLSVVVSIDTAGRLKNSPP